VSSDQEVIVIAAGGTGGHIFPALSVAKELKKRKGSRRIVFIGSKRGLERKIIPGEGFELIEMNIAGIKGKKLSEKLPHFIKAMTSLFQCLRDLKRLKPSIVIGTGSYVSGPVVFAGWLLRIPTVIQEQNLYPGITNRFLSRIVRETAASFEGSKRFLHGRVTVTGNPVREEFLTVKKKARGGRFSLLIFGGSQGARSINKGMLESLPLLKEFQTRLQIVHQTGPSDLEMVKDAYRREEIHAEVFEFLKDMPERFQGADLMVCRAGASTIAEILAAGRASILVPFPMATNDHQRKNARALEEQGAAIMCDDAAFSGEYIASQLKRFLQEPSLLDEMEKRAAALHKGWATGKIADITERIMLKG
jgi:UDP-N-acetylglucosamine--N-acetylmuramyl-(pentapeptide) pyrophosphoryl-undecaprenol N-acetylglucosamine transferase